MGNFKTVRETVVGRGKGEVFDGARRVPQIGDGDFAVFAFDVQAGGGDVEFAIERERELARQGHIHGCNRGEFGVASGQKGRVDVAETERDRVLFVDIGVMGLEDFGLVFLRHFGKSWGC